jgi:hypothetical protein
MRAFLALAALFLGCSNDADAVAGQGILGLTSDGGSRAEASGASKSGTGATTGPTLVWKDATGATITRLFAMTAPSGFTPDFRVGFVYFDDAGNGFSVDREGVSLGPFAALDDQSGVLFTTPDCSGSAYLPIDQMPLPRFTFSYQVGANQFFAARPDTMKGTRLVTHSELDRGTCSRTDANELVVPMSIINALPHLSLPQFPFVGPFHPELVNAAVP